MNFKAEYFPYKQTGAFSKIVTDYIEGASSLQPFYLNPPSFEGIKNAISLKNKFPEYNRRVLSDALTEQYKGLPVNATVQKNIISLLEPNTFTICTAHQPNIFTGHLYFIYKIIHAIKLAGELNVLVTDAHFVPVFYMGSEDADLQELGQVTINGRIYKWNTNQKGAVGRMKVDKAFIDLIEGMNGQLSIEKFGNNILSIIKKAYTIGKTIEQATLKMVNELFGDLGLVVILPDNPALKKTFIPVVLKELNDQFSSNGVAETIALFPKEYKIQAAGRSINLFYLKDDIRERLEISGDGFVVANTSVSFTKSEMNEEVNNYPERFSPNVILRPLYQEMILPNIVFIGGGGELAYWLELKNVFEMSDIQFPVLILRNSFMLLNPKIAASMNKLGFDPADIFKTEEELIKHIVEKESKVKLQLDSEKAALKNIYDKMAGSASIVDSTLKQHVINLSLQALKRITGLEKKIFRAEKKKFDAQQRQIKKIKAILFPGGVLQERTDNLLPYFSIWGPDFLNAILHYSTGLKQQFCVLTKTE